MHDSFSISNTSFSKSSRVNIPHFKDPTLFYYLQLPLSTLIQSLSLSSVDCEYRQQSVEVANQAGDNIDSFVAHFAEVSNMSEIIAHGTKDQGVIIQVVNNNPSKINIII